ncbi:MAG TPA: DoxX family protein [Ohtaekwangia sp.]|uniref:DoxX family protein n=1 Tax=Ohtaekwangia sp. TaxID=2066019 RepID=UPI002F95DF68
MKRDKIIYWITTSLAMLLGGISSFFYFTQPMIEGFRHLGYPDFFRVEIAIGKMLGVFLLLIPGIPAKLKEWTYVAFGLVFISASIAHSAVDGFAKGIIPLLPLALLVTSYIYFNKLQQYKKAAM